MLVGNSEPSITLTSGQTTATLTVRLMNDANLNDEQTLVVRATSLKEGRWPVISETTVLVSIRR